MKRIIVLLLFLLTIRALAQSPTEPTVYIPVVVHVILSGQPNEIFPADPQIITKIEAMNAIFNGSAAFLGNRLDIGIQFRMAKLSPECSSTNGIKRPSYAENTEYRLSGVQFETRSGISEVELKKKTQWETSQYLNIWIVNKIDGIDSGAYTWRPTEAAGRDGIVITSKDFMTTNSPILVNQLGRFFNLYDLSAKLIPNASVFCGDDDVADTDPVEAYSGDARTGINPCTNNPYDVRTEYNFMSHNNLRNQFTQGQKVRMRDALQLHNRKSLVNSITDEFTSCIFNNSSLNTPIFTTNTFKTLGIGKDGYIYAGTANNGLYRFDGHIWEKCPLLPDNNINDIKTDKNGGIWIAQYGRTNGNTTAYLGGLNFFSDPTYKDSTYYAPLSSGLPSRSCRAIFIDTSATQLNPRVWTANFAQVSGGESSSGAVGLGINNTSPKFTSITAGIDISAQNVSVQTIGGDENEIWAFASGNFGKNQILVYNSQTGAYKKAYDNTSIGFSFPSSFLAKSIYFDVLAKKNSNIDRRWVGVSNYGVLIYQKPVNQISEGTWTYINSTAHPTKFPTNTFVNNNSITSDENGNIYFGTNNGLVVFFGGDVADSSNYKRYTTVEGLPSNNVLDIIDAPQLGRIIIATAEGIVFWSREKFKKNLSTYTISNLIENFNQAHYTVPREATIHHYYLIKNNITGLPQKGVTIIYKYNNNDFEYSDQSDEQGLIDLNFSVGGGNPNTSTDDNIPAGFNDVIISFDHALNDHFERVDIGSNVFSSNTFTVSVLDKAEPKEKEFGASVLIEAGVEGKEGAKFNVGNVDFEAGWASISAGFTNSRSITIFPDKLNPELWKVKFASPFGGYLKGSLGPKTKFSVPKLFGEAGVSADLEIRGSNIEEYTYLLNLSKYSDKFFLTSLLVNQMNNTPNSLLLRQFFYNLAKYGGLASSEKYGLNIGLNSKNKIGAFGGINNFWDTDDVNLGMGIRCFLDFKSNIEMAFEKKGNEEVNISSKVSASIDASGNFTFGGNGFGLKSLEVQKSPFKFLGYAKNYSIKLNRSIKNDVLQEGVSTISSGGTKTLAEGGFNITVNNNYKYSRKALDYFKNKNHLVKKFFDNNPVPNAFSLLSTHEESSNAFNQIVNFQKYLLDENLNTFSSEDINVKIEREISKKTLISIPFEVTLFAGVKFKFEMEGWNKYLHSSNEYRYSKEVNHLLQTTDYPEIESNIILPSQNPIITFLGTLNDMILVTPAQEKVEASSFVNMFSKIVENGYVYFSNLNSPSGSAKRLYLDGSPFNNSTKNATQNTTPSVFTFTVPGGNQAFNTGTNLLFKYYYPENQLQAPTATDTLRIITDVFFLNAVNGITDLNIAPNGSFTINTQFSNYELELAGLPANLTPQVLFLPNGSNTWEVIGPANQPINFNRLGVFALGVSLQKDFVPPTIMVIPPSSFVDGQQFSVSLNDNLSGIDWSKTYFIGNGKIIPYQRVGTSNTFNLDVALLHSTPTQSPEVFDIQVRTFDLAGNKKSFFQTYPCKKAIKFLNILGGGSTLNKHQALETIEVSGSAVIPPSIELKAGKSVLLNPGFNSENSGGYFKAEIGGCNTSNAPAQPYNFTLSSSIVCKGQTGVVYTVPNVSGVTYNWSYTGTGATINGAGNSITINFAANATAGILSVTATNGAGISPALTLAITANIPPAPPTAPNINSATGATASVLASGCATYKWYDQATNGTLLFTGNPFVTPILNTNATYYVACADTPCPETGRTAVTVTVGAVPAQPAAIVGSGTVCQGRAGIAYLVPAVSGATSYTWTYSGTGISFVGGISNTRTITIDFGYAATSGVLSVTANNTFGPSTARTMAVTLSPAPPAPTATGVTISSGNSANLTATGCSIYKWYTQASGGTAFTGQNFTTPTLNNTTTYYVACNPGTSCESPRVPVVVTVQ